MSAPGGGAAKADGAICRQPLIKRFLITMPAFLGEFATRRSFDARHEAVAGSLPQMEVAGVEAVRP
jgi:hypothetical protein